MFIWAASASLFSFTIPTCWFNCLSATFWTALQPATLLSSLRYLFAKNTLCVRPQSLPPSLFTSFWWRKSSNSFLKQNAYILGSCMPRSLYHSIWLTVSQGLERTTHYFTSKFLTHCFIAFQPSALLLGSLMTFWPQFHSPFPTSSFLKSSQILILIPDVLRCHSVSLREAPFTYFAVHLGDPSNLAIQIFLPLWEKN